MYAFETVDIHTVNFMTVILLQTLQSGSAAVCITLQVIVSELTALRRYNLNYPPVQFFVLDISDTRL